MRQNQEIIFDKYSALGAGYHWIEYSNNPLKMGCFLKARYEKCEQLLLEKFGKLNEIKILDMGCGDGVLTHLLAKKGAICYGIDLDAKAIEYTKRKFLTLGLNADFTVQSCYETSFKTNTFDVVVSSDVIEHLQQPSDMLKEINRILKPGGWAIISTPIRITELPEDKNHVYEWFHDEFKLLINNVYPKSEFRRSHALLWYEIYSRSFRFQLPVNFLSYFYNPFLCERGWKHFCLQYAIIHKESV